MRRSGKDVLYDIDKRASKTRSRIQKITHNISEMNATLEDLREREAQAYLELAELRYELLDDPNVVAQMSDAEKKAKKSLQARQGSRQNLEKLLLENQTQQTTVEQKRADILDTIERFSETVEAAEKKALLPLENDDDYNALLIKIDELEAQVTRIDHKIDVAKEDYEKKVTPYKADPLFSYLWDVGYGTSEYTTNMPLFRTLDNWVARICKYQDARKNYAMLSSIPEKLELHKEFMFEQIEALKQQQQHKEQDAFEAGNVAKLQNEYAMQHAALADTDAQIIKLENEHQSILQDQEAVSQNKDEFYNNAISTLKDIYKSQSLRNLRRNASVTATKDDDALIQTLYRLDDQIDDMEERLSEYQSSLHRERTQLAEVQKVRQTFKKKNYDSHRTTFNDPNMFTILLGQFVTGILTNTHFWSAVGRLCIEIFDEIEIDTGRSRKRHRYNRRRHRPSRQPKRRHSSGGFRTGGRF